MFARRNRFSFKKGVPRKIFSTPFFVIRHEKSVDKTFRCAVVVGKKVDKRAVVRNRIKRHIVATVKELLAHDTEMTIVIYAKKPIAELATESIEEEFKKAIQTIQK